MDLQPLDDDARQNEQSEHVLQQQPDRNHGRWYRSRSRKARKNLIFSTLIALVVVGLFAAAVSWYGTRPLSKSNLPPGQPMNQLTPTGGLTQVTPPPAQVDLTPIPQATSHSSTPSTSQGNGTTQPQPPPVANSGSATVYYGVHMPFMDMSLVANFEANAQKRVALVMWYQHWGETDGYQNFQVGWMNAVRAHGSIPLVTWDPWDPNNGSANQPAYSLQNIINGNFDSYIVRWAQASRSWGHPFFLRFAPEMNGYWFPWSEQENGNKPGQFVLAWRHVHNIFTAQGATNVTWVWAPNIIFSNSIPLGELYPGNAYVDWAAMDGYNWGTVGAWHYWESLTALFQQTYQAISSITYKPMMIAETASTEQGGNKASWITTAFTSQLADNFPRIHAFVWFDLDKETDWRIESSSASRNAFASAMQSGMFASNWYASLNVSPIPIP
jgi:glycosyl hydrolase family 26